MIGPRSTFGDTLNRISHVVAPLACLLIVVGSVECRDSGKERKRNLCHGMEECSWMLSGERGTVCAGQGAKSQILRGRCLHRGEPATREENFDSSSPPCLKTSSEAVCGIHNGYRDMIRHQIGATCMHGTSQ